MTALGFPVNLTDALARSFAPSATAGIEQVVQRRLRPTDPNGTLAIFGDSWLPLEFEIGGGEMIDATRARYQLGLHFVVRVAGDSPAGTAQAAQMAKIIRTKLYRDHDVGVRLRACSETIGGVTERVAHWKVEETKFFDTPISNTFVFLSTIRMWVETITA